LGVRAPIAPDVTLVEREVVGRRRLRRCRMGDRRHREHGEPLRHGRPNVMLKLPQGSTTARWPGYTTIVVKASSTIAGPLMAWPATRRDPAKVGVATQRPSKNAFRAPRRALCAALRPLRGSPGLSSIATALSRSPRRIGAWSRLA